MRLTCREGVSSGGGLGRLSRCFEELKPRERALLWLAYVEGYAHAEIGTALDLSEKSVKVLLFRARGNLERILRENGYGVEVPA
jgi:RNA polymerase sigma factor (sigma-70 family)